MKAVVVCLALSLAACVNATATATASPATPVSATPPLCSDTDQSAPWRIYDAPDYRFSICYPPTFVVDRMHGVPGTGLVMAYRAVAVGDLTNNPPPGQIEMTVYTSDADTLSGWLSKHSGPPSSSDMTRYWSPPTNQVEVTVQGRPRLSFDWIGDGEGAMTVHATALFLGTAYVFVLQWWSTFAPYSASIEDDYHQMLASFREFP